jgi:hypothetical protein
MLEAAEIMKCVVEIEWCVKSMFRSKLMSTAESGYHSELHIVAVTSLAFPWCCLGSYDTCCEIAHVTALTHLQDQIHSTHSRAVFDPLSAHRCPVYYEPQTIMAAQEILVRLNDLQTRDREHQHMVRHATAENKAIRLLT